jgi:hypothetical protein
MVHADDVANFVPCIRVTDPTQPMEVCVPLFKDKPSDDGGVPADGGANSARTVIREVRGPVEERVAVLRSALSRATSQHPQRSGWRSLTGPIEM